MKKKREGFSIERDLDSCKPDIIFEDTEYPTEKEYELSHSYKKRVCFSIPSFREIKRFLKTE